MKYKNIHLNEDQLIYAVIDENDLSAREYNHLKQCFNCKKRKDQFKQQLSSLGEMANSFVPARQKIYPVFQENRRKFRIFNTWKPAFAAGFAAILLFLGIWNIVYQTPSSEVMIAQLIQEMVEDQELLSEVIELEEYDFYIDISGENLNTFSDEFMDFIVPVKENQDMSKVKSLILYS
ncbi:Zinc-finger domain-containing protein [Candidatus Magnetomoraceae bacterium gMMP-15]